MKSFCKNCESLQPSSFRLEHDAETRKPYEDLCCNTCHFVVATVQGREALALPAQEPDALTIAYQSGFYDGKKAAQRPWVGLTKDEMLAVVHYSQLDNARAIEAKLRERNS
jgi:hypothetical protein